MPPDGGKKIRKRDVQMKRFFSLAIALALIISTFLTSCTNNGKYTAENGCVIDVPHLLGMTADELEDEGYERCDESDEGSEFTMGIDNYTVMVHFSGEYADYVLYSPDEGDFNDFSDKDKVLDLFNVHAYGEDIRWNKTEDTGEASWNCFFDKAKIRSVIVIGVDPDNKTFRSIFFGTI